MKVVVTGMGVVSSLGANVDAFWENLLEGRRGFVPISLFDASVYKCDQGAEIRGVDLREFVGLKSADKYDRLQMLIIGSSQMAWENADLEEAPYKPCELGVILGSTYGYIDSVSRFYMESLREGPAYVSPIAFANTVMNAPAGKISIRFQITGLCSTIASGETSGLDAMAYATDFIRFGRIKAALVGAGSVLCDGSFMGFHHTGKLSGSGDGVTPFCRPFDRRADGIVLGEGAAMLVLESLETARERNAPILAEVKGFGGHFSPSGESEEAGIYSAVMCMQKALEQSGLAPADISLVSAGANSNPRADRMEAAAICNLFGNLQNPPLVTAIKGNIGECLDASAALQAAAGICSLQDGRIPFASWIREPLETKGLNLALTPGKALVDAVLVNAFGCEGNKTSLVLKKYQDT